MTSTSRNQREGKSLIQGGFRGMGSWKNPRKLNRRQNKHYKMLTRSLSEEDLYISAYVDPIDKPE